MIGKTGLKLKHWICGILIISMVLTTGCWDRIEVNDITLIMASAFDSAPEGKIQASVQVMLPSGGRPGSGMAGSGTELKKSFVVETATGIDLGDAMGKIQQKFSRKLFRGHRRAIVIGEEMARRGIEEILDSISRDPENRLRTHMLVSKGKKGLDLLKIEYPMERVPAEAMREMINTGVGVEVTIRDFLIMQSNEGIEPVATIIEPGDDKEGFKLEGIAIFKDLRLVGYLSGEETIGYLWTVGKLEKGTVTAQIPGNEGVVSIDIRNAKSKITPKTEDGKMKFYVEISAEGAIHGNSTRLDLTIPKNIELAEKAAKAEVKKQAEETIKTVQEKYKADIFGFGSTINQGNPEEWKKLKERWNDEIFPNVEVPVSVDFNIRQTGMSGPPLHLKENEVKK